MRVTDPADPRLGDFTALNDPERRRRVERDGNYFVVEGILAIERLLALPQWSVRRVVVLPRVLDRLGALLTDRPFEVLVADESVLRSVVGFDLHRGALASVDRPPRRAPDEHSLRGADLVVVAEGVNDHENLGALYRNAAAFGVGAVILDPGCADPFYRRSVRVSLGHVLAVPTLHAEALPRGLERLHDLGVTTVALSPSAPDRLESLRRSELGPGPVALMVGAEGPGLSAETMTVARRRISIAMADGVDSVNVATAAAIALHHLRTGVS